jgi:hypothetical protein
MMRVAFVVVVMGTGRRPGELRYYSCRVTSSGLAVLFSPDGGFSSENICLITYSDAEAGNSRISLTGTRAKGAPALCLELTCGPKPAHQTTRGWLFVYVVASIRQLHP